MFGPIGFQVNPIRADGIKANDRFDVRTVQHWMGHKSLETTMRYLAPATDVHDELDLVTIPAVGKAAPAPRKSAAREARSSRKAAGGRSDAGAKGLASGN